MGDFFGGTIIRIPIKQSGFNGKVFFFVAQMGSEKKDKNNNRNIILSMGIVVRIPHRNTVYRCCYC